MRFKEIHDMKFDFIRMSVEEVIGCQYYPLQGLYALDDAFVYNVYQLMWPTSSELNLV